jgi:predicted transcriptional regulator YdeE
MTLNVTIKEFPSRHLVGMYIRTSMQKAGTDCPALWQAFGPRIANFPNSGSIKETYGLGQMIGDDGTFDYWAVAEFPADAPIPTEMKAVELPAGLYACTFAPNLEQMESVFQEMFTDWQQQQSEYIFNMQVPVVEVYKEGWQLSDPFELWFPIIKKS